MPVDDEKTTVEVNDLTEGRAAKKGGSKLFLFAGIGIGAVLIAVALVLFVVKPMMSGSSEESDDAQTEQADGHKPAKKKSDSHGGGAALAYTISDIVVNPAGTGGQRFLSVSFGFELGSQELASQFEQREALVRDALITILSSKTVSQLTDAKQKEIMRYQIKRRLEKVLATDELEAVYYTDFVLQ